MAKKKTETRMKSSAHPTLQDLLNEYPELLSNRSVASIINKFATDEAELAELNQDEIEALRQIVKTAQLTYGANVFTRDVNDLSPREMVCIIQHIMKGDFSGVYESDELAAGKKYVHVKPAIVPHDAIDIDKDQFRDLRITAPFDTEVRRFDVTRKVNRALQTGKNPFMPEFPSLEAMLDAMQTNDRKRLINQYELLKMQYSGQRRVNGVEREIVDYKPEGLPTLASLLAAYSYKQATLTGSLPLGDLSTLSVANRLAYANMADMLFRRYIMCGALDVNHLTADREVQYQRFLSNVDQESYDRILAALREGAAGGDAYGVNDAPSLDSINAEFERTGGSGSSFWPLEGSRSALNDFVKEMQFRMVALYDSARDRHMINTLITPLLRNSLVDRGDIYHIIPERGRIFGLAREYARLVRWKKSGYATHQISARVGGVLQEYNWIKSMISLQEQCVNKVTVDLTTALDVLKRLHVEWHRQVGSRWLVTTPLIEDADGNRVASRTLDMINPFGEIVRDPELKNLHGDVIGLHDDFEPTLSDLSVMDAPTISAIVRLLTSVDTDMRVSNPDVREITKRPEWSGLIELRDCQILDSDIAFVDQLDDMFVHVFMHKLMSGKFINSPLATLYDLPNGTDLLKDYYESFQIMALCHDAVQEVLQDLLNIVACSYEWHDNPVWEILSTTGLFVSSPITLESFSLTNASWQERFRKSALVSYEGDEARMTRYYFETETKRERALPSVVMDFLETADAICTRTTHFQFRKPFKSDALPVVDVLAALNDEHGMTSGMLRNLLASGRVVRLGDLSPADPIFSRSFTTTLVPQRAALPGVVRDDADGLMILANVDPYLRITFAGLSYDDLHPIKVMMNALTSSKADGGAGVDPNEPIILRGRVLPYNGLTSYDVLDPSILMDVEQTVTPVDVFDQRVRIPRTMPHIQTMLRRSAYTLLGGVVEDEQYMSLFKHNLRSEYVNQHVEPGGDVIRPTDTELVEEK